MCTFVHQQCYYIESRSIDQEHALYVAARITYTCVFGRMSLPNAKHQTHVWVLWRQSGPRIRVRPTITQLVYTMCVAFDSDR